MRSGNFLILRGHITKSISDIIWIVFLLNKDEFKVFFIHFLKMVSWRWPPLSSMIWECQNPRFRSTLSMISASYIDNTSMNIVLRYPHRKKITDCWPLQINPQRDETSGLMFAQESRWHSCHVSRGAVLLKPHIRHIPFFKFGKVKHLNHLNINLRSDCNCLIVLFKMSWSSKANSG